MNAIDWPSTCKLDLSACTVVSIPVVHGSSGKTFATKVLEGRNGGEAVVLHGPNENYMLYCRATTRGYPSKSQTLLEPRDEPRGFVYRLHLLISTMRLIVCGLNSKFI
jgi:hypothetical protein